MPSGLHGYTLIGSLCLASSIIIPDKSVKLVTNLRGKCIRSYIILPYQCMLPCGVRIESVLYEQKFWRDKYLVFY